MRTSTSFDAIWSTRFGKRRCWVNCRTAAKLEVELDSKAIAELANGLLEDPATWDQSWSAEIPMMSTEGPMYESACHEGNHDIRHILEVYRKIEKQEAEGTS